MKLYILTGICAFFIGCAARHPQALPPPLINTPVEPVKTTSLENNINKLNQALKRASSTIDRIDILIDSIPDNDKK